MAANEVPEKEETYEEYQARMKKLAIMRQYEKDGFFRIKNISAKAKGSLLY